MNEQQLNIWQNITDIIGRMSTIRINFGDVMFGTRVWLMQF